MKVIQMPRFEYSTIICGLPQEWQIIRYCRKPRTIHAIMSRFGCSFDVKELLDRMYERGDLQRLIGGANYPRIFWYVVASEGGEWVRDHSRTPVGWRFKPDPPVRPVSC